RLYFWPEPHGHGSLRPTLSDAAWPDSRSCAPSDGSGSYSVAASPAAVGSAKAAAELGAHERLSGQAASDKVGRNDPCPCGSGQKYKRCHGA
ncbi:MAG TPA: SEC-C metal-binding domain-containing protein, partial [Egibacteraceae bacterium]|nr:SEC-C metal-binding domain-containing protein [Egibacteraceae bacterium]